MPTLDKVTVDLMVVLGTTSMPIHQVMRLSRGAIIELDATEADEVKILANNLPIASGGENCIPALGCSMWFATGVLAPALSEPKARSRAPARQL